MMTKLAGITVLSLALAGTATVARADHFGGSDGTRIVTEVTPRLEKQVPREHLHLDRGAEIAKLRALLDAERRRADAAEYRATEAERKIGSFREAARAAEAKANTLERSIASLRSRMIDAEHRATAAENRVAAAENRVASAEARTTAAEARAAQASRDLEPLVRRVRDAEAKQIAAENRAEAAERRLAVLERLLKAEREEDRRDRGHGRGR